MICFKFGGQLQKIEAFHLSGRGRKVATAPPKGNNGKRISANNCTLDMKVRNETLGLDILEKSIEGNPVLLSTRRPWNSL